MLAIILEPISWIFDGLSFSAAYFVEYVSNLLLIVIAPIISSIMLSYVRYYLKGTHNSLLHDVVHFMPFWFTIVALIVNMFYPIYFSVDEVTNGYSSGSYLWLHYVMILVIYIYMITITLTYGKDQDKKAMMIFAVFFFLPVLGMAVQLINTRINYSWNFIVLSILVIFLFLESADGELDFLTGLFNRRSYERYVQQLIQKKHPFQVVYFDLDRFKHINDEYGHLVGDNVLTEFGSLIMETFENGPMVARLGGDEFITVVEHAINVEDAISTLREQILNGSDDIKDLQFSYGVQAYKPGMTIDQLYALVDKKMYQYKRANQNLKRRRSDD